MALLPPITTLASQLITTVGGPDAVVNLQARVREGTQNFIPATLIAGALVTTPIALPPMLFDDKFIVKKDCLALTPQGIVNGETFVRNNNVVLLGCAKRRELVSRKSDNPLTALKQVRTQNPQLNPQTPYFKRNALDFTSWMTAPEYTRSICMPGDTGETYRSQALMQATTNPGLIRKIIDEMLPAVEYITKVHRTCSGIIFSRAIEVRLGVDENWLMIYSNGIRMGFNLVIEARDGRFIFRVPVLSLIHKLYDQLPDKYKKELPSIAALDGIVLPIVHDESRFIEYRRGENMEMMRAICPLAKKSKYTMTKSTFGDGYYTITNQSNMLPLAQTLAQIFTVDFDEEGFIVEGSVRNPSNPMTGIHRAIADKREQTKDKTKYRMNIYAIAGAIVAYQWAGEKPTEEVQSGFLDMFTHGEMAKKRKELKESLGIQGYAEIIKMLKDKS